MLSVPSITKSQPAKISLALSGDSFTSQVVNFNDEFIVDFMKEWKKNSGKVEKREKDSDLGGTLRLGIYDTVLKKNSLAHKLYKK